MSDDATARLVEQLVSARLAAGMTQLAVAQAMGSYQPYLSKLEAGRVPLRFDVIERYARAVGLRLVWRIELATNEPGPVELDPEPEPGEPVEPVELGGDAA